MKRLTRSHYLRFKRILDLTLSLLSLPITVPVMGLIAILIRLDSKGDSFFVQERVGQGHRKFRLYKFRTMKNNHRPENDRAFMQAFVSGTTSREKESGKTLNKPYRETDLTRFGKFLRKTSLDELPQVFNVIKGEMSIVGPRPNLPWEVDAYQPWHCERLEVLPGITGLAQVNGRSELTFDEIAKYDIEYVRNCSLGMDIRLLMQTVLTVFNGKGAG